MSSWRTVSIGETLGGGRTTSIANTVLRKHINVKEGEEVLILIDRDTPLDFPNAFYSVAHMLGAEVTMLVMPSSFLETEKYPTKVVLEALKGCDIYIPMTVTTGKSVHCMEYGKLLAEDKLRAFILGGYHGGALDECLKALREHDYEDVYATTKGLCEYLADKETAHLTSKQGTDVTMSIKDIFNWKIKGGIKRWDGGLAREPGEEACLPDGEAWGAPREGTTEGVIVINGSIALDICDRPEGPDPPVKLTVKEGRVVKVEGGAEAKRIKKLIETVPDVDNIAEIAWGTNRYAELGGGHTQEWDKHVFGAMHMALGHNTYQAYPFGTVDSPIHFDFTLRNHTCVVDGETLVRDNKLLEIW